MGRAGRLDARSRPAGPGEPRLDSGPGGRGADPEHRRVRRRGRRRSSQPCTPTTARRLPSTGCTAERCGFGYRDSVFKREPDRASSRHSNCGCRTRGATNLAYAGLAEELAAMGGLGPTPRNVAAAVRRICAAQAAGPCHGGQCRQLLQEPRRRTRASLARCSHASADMPVFPAPTAAERKLSAAWLIEQAGWRGFRDGDAGVSAQHALVLVNLGQATGPQLLALARRVAASVREKFGVAARARTAHRRRDVPGRARRRIRRRRNRERPPHR